MPNALDILENRGNPFHLMFRHMLLLKHRGGTTHSKSLLNSLVTDTTWETNVCQHLWVHFISSGFLILRSLTDFKLAPS